MDGECSHPMIDNRCWKEGNCRSCLGKAYLKHHLVSLERGESEAESRPRKKEERFREEGSWMRKRASTYRYLNIVMLTWGYCREKNYGMGCMCLCECERACSHLNKYLKLWSVWSAVPNEDLSRCKNAQLFFYKNPKLCFWYNDFINNTY